MGTFSSAAEVVTNPALEETESAVAEQEARLASDYGCLPENRESCELDLNAGHAEDACLAAIVIDPLGDSVIDSVLLRTELWHRAADEIEAEPESRIRTDLAKSFWKHQGSESNPSQFVDGHWTNSVG